MTLDLDRHLSNLHDVVTDLGWVASLWDSEDRTEALTDEKMLVLLRAALMDLGWTVRAVEICATTGNYTEAAALHDRENASIEAANLRPGTVADKVRGRFLERHPAQK